jgi:hypothetical protein
MIDLEKRRRERQKLRRKEVEAAFEQDQARRKYKVKCRSIST